MRVLALWALAGGCAVPGFGAPVSPEQAARMVQGWLELTPAPLNTPLSARTIGSVQPFSDPQGQVVYYAVRLPQEGFIITSADTEVEPVIAFSATGSFEANPDSPLFALVQRDLPGRVAALRQQNQLKGASPSAPSAKWTRLLQQETGRQLTGAGLQVIDDLRVAPFIQSRWNQGAIWNGSDAVACYNYYTPPYAAGTSSNYVCGCNATALAQIMRYFQYPTQPVGTGSFYIEVDGVATTRRLRGGDGLGGPYNWSRMPLVPGAGTTEQERQAIGALTADIGVANNANYYADGTEAGFLNPPLKSVFGFANAMYEASGVSSKFAQEVNANLDARLPIYVGLSSTNGGHAVLCDGYGYNLSTRYHHLNLGWGGDSDAWYNLPDVDAYDRYVVFGLFYNIYTNGTGEIISGRVTTGNRVPVFNASITATRAGGGTYTAATDANGIYALIKVPSASQYTLSVSQTGFATTNAIFWTGTSADSDTCGNVWGADFVLDSAGPPLIVAQPQSQTVYVGSRVVFQVVALSQASLSYQWQDRLGADSLWSNLRDDASYSGSQNATLVLPSASISGLQFRCIVSNRFGAVTSAPPATLTLMLDRGLTITTLAGLAGMDGCADGTQRAGRFSHPRGVAADSAGNVYVADTYNHTIRKVTPAGVVTTLAGLAGISGNADGAGSVARFYRPSGPAVDRAGNIYVADNANHTIRKLTPAGVVTTLAGLAGRSGNADGNGSAARFYYPSGVAGDNAGNLYVSDYINHTIRKLTPAGVVTTLAGLAGSPGSADGAGQAARFSYPSGVAVDNAGDVYVADYGNNTIRKATSAGVVTTLAGLAGSSGGADGTKNAARFDCPSGVAVDSAGNLYVADSGNNTLRKVTPAGVVTTPAGLAGYSGSADGTGNAARFQSPFSVTMDNAGDLYVADEYNCTVRRGFAAGAAAVIVSCWPTFGLQGGQFGFDLAGPAGQAVVIDASTNLTTWFPIWTNTVGAGALCFGDPLGSAFPCRFYRAHTP